MRLIDADALKGKESYIMMTTLDTCFGSAKIFLTETIDNAPTVDAVQIVRCKNCTYFLHDGSDCFCENMEIFGHEKSVSPDWFCADGSAKVGVI